MILVSVIAALTAWVAAPLYRARPAPGALASPPGDGASGPAGAAPGPESTD